MVVGNPPHVFFESEEEYKKDITLYDPGFSIHKKFYRDIRKFLKPTGSILLQEHTESTNVDDFKDMIEQNGLKIIDVFTYTPPKDPVLTKTGFNLPTFQKAVNPVKVYKFLKRKLFPPTPRHYYFIHAKIA